MEVSNKRAQILHFPWNNGAHMRQRNNGPDTELDVALLHQVKGRFYSWAAHNNSKHSHDSFGVNDAPPGSHQGSICTGPISAIYLF